MEEFLDEKWEAKRMDALTDCLGKLRPEDRDLVLHRYWKKTRLQDFAVIKGRSMNGLKVSLFRIRAALKKCIEKEIGTGGDRMKHSPRQLEQLFQDLEDGCISASDSRKLSAILRTEKDARLRYCEHMAFSSAMNTKAEAEASLGSWKPMDPDGRRLLFHSFLAAAAAVLLLGAIAGFIHINRTEVLQVGIQAPAGTVWTIELPDGKSSDQGTTLPETGTVVVRSGVRGNDFGIRDADGRAGAGPREISKHLPRRN